MELHGQSNTDEDKELLYLMSFLEDLVYVSDVREPIREAFKMSYLQRTIIETDSEV